MAMVRAMTQFGLSIEFDKKQVQRWQSRFESEIPGAFARAHKWTVDEIAKAAVTGFRQNAHRHIDRPNAWTLRGIRYRRSTYSANWDEATSAIYVLPDQSAVLKYLMGERVRKPGDVGPSRSYIAVPRAGALAKVGVNLNKHGNMPASTMTRLRREAGVLPTTTVPRPAKGKQARQAQAHAASDTKIRRARKGDGGTFFGRPTFGGKMQPLGFYSRPTKVKKNGKWVGSRNVLMLVYAAQETHHQPIMRRFWQDNAALAADDYAQIMGQELRRKLDFLRDRGA